MSDMIYYKNGEETFRISHPTFETKCPETKLEVKKMNEIEKTEGEMSDVIYYKNGEETFRISHPTFETKCPETKLEVKKMKD